SSSKLARDQTSNSTSSADPTPKGRIRRSSKQKVENSHFEEHLTPVATMTDNRTMAEMLHAPTEGCAEAIIVPPIFAEQFKLKHSLINMMTSKQFFGLKKDNPHDHGQPAGGLKKNPRQKFDESFLEAWERYKDLLRACPHHDFTELHQLDTFYNALNPADQDSLNAAAVGNLLEKTHVKAVEEINVTCGGAHPYYQCLAAGGNTFLEYWDNIQGYVSAATGNYNQGNPGYRPQGVANQMRPPGSGTLPGNTIANPKGELKAITTRSGLVTEGPTVPNPLKSVNQEEDECVKETYTDPDHAEYNIKVPPPPLVQKPKPSIQRNFVLHTRDSLPPHIPTTYSANSLLEEFADELALISYPLDYDDNRACDIESDIREIEFLLYQANSLLEEFADELALITYPPDYDDNCTCDIESDLREIEFLLYQGEDFDFKDSIDQSDLANLDDLFFDPTPEMFTDEQPPDYSFPPRFDVYLDDFLEIESDAVNFDDDLFDSKGEKIKESELLIDQLDLPCDIHPEYDSFNSQDFSKDDDLPSPDKIGIRPEESFLLHRIY
nr:reverse transcriptase domain-containing protein [Tanacetum cinerariifolium]